MPHAATMKHVEVFRMNTRIRASRLACMGFEEVTMDFAESSIESQLLERASFRESRFSGGFVNSQGRRGGKKRGAWQNHKRLSYSSIKFYRTSRITSFSTGMSIPAL